MSRLVLPISRMVGMVLVVALLLPFTTSVSEINPANNNKQLQVTIIETSPLNITFVKFQPPFSSFTEYEGNARKHANYLNSTYPVSDSGLKIDIREDRYFAGFGGDISCSVELVKEFERNTRLLGYNGSENKYDKLIGFVPESELENGCSYWWAPGYEHLSVVSEKFRLVTAHEVAHLFDICHDSSQDDWNIDKNALLARNAVCRNRNVSMISNDSKCGGGTCKLPANEALLVRQLFTEANWVSGSKTSDLNNFMGSLPPPGLLPNWIDNETYIPLADYFKINHAPVFTTSKIIVLRGSDFNNSVPRFEEYQFTVNGGILSQPSTYDRGNLSVIVKNSLGVVLYNFSHNPAYSELTFGGDGTIVNESPFIFAFPYENVSTIQLYETGVLRDSISLSPNTPNVLVSSMAGLVFDAPFNISWNASDADNDPLQYAILISSDNGSTWSALVADINQSSYITSNTNFITGNNYRVKILATDGVNTGSNESGTFTILVPPVNLWQDLTFSAGQDQTLGPNCIHPYYDDLRITTNSSVFSVGSSWGFEENATTSSNSSNELFDGNYSTRWSPPTEGTSYEYVNYTTPFTALSTSLLQLTDEEGAVFNQSIPQRCFDQSVLQLRARAAYPDAGQIGVPNFRWYCYNGTDWAQVHNYGEVNGFYEEAIWWVQENGTLLFTANESAAGTHSVAITCSDPELNATKNIAVTITSSSGQPRLSLSLITPLANGNVTKNQFFSFTTQVCCLDASCGSLNVSLDPEATTYTHYSQKHCVGEECTTSIYAWPHFGFEDDAWKPIEELRSFKGTIPIECHVDSDGEHDVECIEYNATHRTLRITAPVGIVPIRVLTPTDTAFVETASQDVLFESPEAEVASSQDVLLGVPEEIVEETNETPPVIEETTPADVMINAGSEESPPAAEEAPLDPQPIEIVVAAGIFDEVHVGPTSTNISYLPNSSAIEGYWESTGGSLAMYAWSNCDATAYNGADLSHISVNTTAESIYGQGGGSATNYTYCYRIRWNVTEEPNNITKILAYGRWTGSLSGGADSITKALYIGNVTGHTWKALDVKSNAWGEVQHVGEVTAAITDFVNDTASGNYVYTLLHMNASKAGSTYAYSNYYYAELQITSGTSGGGGNATKSGLVSTVAGTTPFYTNGTNPVTINLNASQCQNITWYVNATGNLSTTHTFFAYANLTNNASVNNRTSSVNVTITNATAGGWTVIDTDTFASSDEGWTGGGRDTTATTYNSTGDWGTLRKNYTLSTGAAVINITINDFWYGDDTTDPKIFVPGDTASDNDYLLFDGTKPNINWKHIDDNGGYGECNQEISGAVSWADGDSVTILVNYTSGQWCTYHNGQKCRCETGTLAHGDNFEISVGNAHVTAIDDVRYSGLG